jgi:drug/metabolite transporter (DMT)-like permease
MLLAPLFFSTNLVFGRGVVDEVAPFTLAFLRWAAVALALSPFLFLERDRVRNVIRRRPGLLILLGFLGMWVCGGMVYLGLQATTATNATLIYTTSPVIIILLEWLFRGRAIGLREGLGSALAFAGVALIVLRGDPASLLRLDLNLGDLAILLAAIAWAGYSILYRSSDLAGLSTMALLGLVAAVGAALLLPVSLWEWLSGQAMPSSANAWGGIAGIVLFSSLLAFSTFQFGIRELGASVAGVFMYLLPPYGVLLAVIILGERFEPFHAAGIVTVMSGIVLATFPKKLRG